MIRKDFSDSWVDVGEIPLSYNFTELWNLHPSERGKVMVFGEKTVPRYQQSYLHDYTFSGVEAKALPLPKEFSPFLDYVNSLDYGTFNQVLLNWYEPEHYIGTHRDSEKQLVPNSPIVTISLGGSRTFRIRDNEKKIVKDFVTSDGMILVMGDGFQKLYKHEIVKITGKKTLAETKPRISITFRQFI